MMTLDILQVRKNNEIVKIATVDVDDKASIKIFQKISGTDVMSVVGTQVMSGKRLRRWNQMRLY